MRKVKTKIKLCNSVTSCNFLLTFYYACRLFQLNFTRSSAVCPSSRISRISRRRLALRGDHGSLSAADFYFSKSARSRRKTASGDERFAAAVRNARRQAAARRATRGIWKICSSWHAKNLNEPNAKRPNFTTSCKMYVENLSASLRSLERSIRAKFDQRFPRIAGRRRFGDHHLRRDARIFAFDFDAGSQARADSDRRRKLQKTFRPQAARHLAARMRV